MAITTAQASFDGTQDFVDVAVPDQGGTSYGVLLGVEFSDPVMVTTDPAFKTNINVRVVASGRFTGTVYITLYPR